MKKIPLVLVIICGITICLLIGLSIIGGTIMNKPLISKKEIILEYNIKNIWDIVVDNNDYTWRTGIKKLELLENGIWIEYYDDAGKYFTKFTLKEKNEYTLYSFEMENKNYYGEWIGQFIEINKNETKCVFTETIYIKNKIMRVLAKLFWNMEKIQEQYFKDLKNRLEK
jgi:hypothetical protein